MVSWVAERHHVAWCSRVVLALNDELVRPEGVRKASASPIFHHGAGYGVPIGRARLSLPSFTSQPKAAEPLRLKAGGRCARRWRTRENETENTYILEIAL